MRFLDWWRPATGALSLGLAAAWYGSRVETRWLRITRLTLPIGNLPPAFDGYRIAHLSDLHVGVGITEQYLPLVVGATNRDRPDLLVLTGDLATAGRDGLAAGSAILAGLRAPDGCWAVLGNHDHYVGAARVADALQRAGIAVLHNRHHLIERGADRLAIAGVDDVLWGLPDLAGALAGLPHDSPAILLAHEPDFARVAAADRRVVLQLSGHTHGGQVCPPGMKPPLLPQFGHVYPAGLYRVGRLMLYVTAGTGTGRFAFRFNCRPEIAIITLARADDGGQTVR